MNVRSLRTVRFLFFLPFIVWSAQGLSQDPDQELGLKANGFSGFSFLYKKQRTDTTFTRFSVDLINGAYNRSRSFGVDDTNTRVFQRVKLGVSLGNEVRTRIKGPVHFIRGIDPSLRLAFSNASVQKDGKEERSRKTMDLEPVLGYLLGLHYKIGPRIYFNLHTSPHVRGDIPINFKGWNDSYGIRLGIRYGFSFAFKL